MQQGKWSGCVQPNDHLMAEDGSTPKPLGGTTWQQFSSLLRPHWKLLSLALLAVLGEAAADLLDPWPLKIIIDNLLRG